MRPSRSAMRNVISTLHRSELVTAEEVICRVPGKQSQEPGQTDRFHIVLPLSGSFLYQEGSKSYFGGANHMLLVPAGREYRISHPIHGDRSLILYPKAEIIERFEVLASAAAHDTEIRLALPAIRVAAFKLVHAGRRDVDAIMLDELAINFCGMIDECDPVRGPSTTLNQRSVLSRAKEFLHAHYGDPINLALTARSVGVSAPYLTQLFHEAVGLPLHQYLMHLRLSEALNQIPDAPDLTGLALDLGFSSHSHFSSVFRSKFGATPASLRLAGHAYPARSRTVHERPLCSARGGDCVDL